MHLEQLALIVADYDDAIAFYTGVLGFELVEDSPSETNDGRPKRWVVVRPPGAQTAILLAQADGERQAAAVGDQFAGRVGLFLRVDDFGAVARAPARGRRGVLGRAARRALRARRGLHRPLRQPLGPARPAAYCASVSWSMNPPAVSGLVQRWRRPRISTGAWTSSGTRGPWKRTPWPRRRSASASRSSTSTAM